MSAAHLKFALRAYRKRKLFTFINIIGLSLGVAVCLIILNYVAFELSYDRHHTNGPFIYRTILTRYINGEFRDITPLTGYGAGPALLADLPEIKQTARAHALFGGAVLSSTENPDRNFHENHAYLVDPSFLQMFTLNVLAGNLSTALNQPNSIVVTRSIAEKYYDGLTALNKTLKITGGWMDSEFIITAIIEDQPENTSLVFDFLLPIEDLLANRQYVEDNGWGWKNFETFLQVHAETDMRKFADKMPAFLSKYVTDKQEMSFQPLFDIHTQPGLAFDSTDRISKGKIDFYVLIAIFILCIAWINYINLATARAIERAREVGIKKAIGAQRRQLVLQFLMESALINSMAVVFAVLLAIAFSPLMIEVTGKKLVLNFEDPRLWTFLAAMAIFGTIVSGIYPALVLSSFKATIVLKGGAEKISNVFPLRKLLVVFQFACSLILVSMTMVVHRQLRFMENEVQSLNMDQILIVKAPYVLEREGQDARLLTFKDQLKNLSYVRSVTSSAGIPGGGYTFTTIMRKAGAPTTEQQSGNVIWVDPDFIDTYNIQMLAGKVWDVAVTPKKTLIINETAMSDFNITNAEDALAHEIILESDTLAIVGVMKDYYWNSLKTASVPVLFLPVPIVKHTFSIALNTNQYSESVAQIESLFKNSFPGNPVEYYFLDSFFDQQYKSDRNFGRIFTWFSILAVAIACLGLLGLTAFTTDKRLKEISIRKVLGASQKNIISMLTRDFVSLVMFSGLLSLPIMWYVSTNWLDSFAHKTDLTLDIFLSPVFILMAICLVTVSAHILRGARSNPADVLKSE